MSQTIDPAVPEGTVAVDDLRRVVTGEVITPGDPGYDDARQVFYGGFDRRPAAVVRATGTHDVAAVVTFAGAGGIELAVRSGGHSASGHGTSDGGIVLDLSRMRDLEIDVEGRTAWAQTGLTAGAFTAAAAEHDLGVGFGDAGSVGLGGLTVGGGMGFLSRKHGLTIDSVLAAEVVTADGHVRQVDEDHEPELFWAIRGGGGNLGVVTRLRFALHDVGQVSGGLLVLPATAEVIAGFVAAADAAPDEIGAIANVMVAPPMPFVPAEVHGKLVVLATVLHAGPRSESDRAFAPFRELATPLVDALEPMAYPDLYPPEPEGFHPTALAHTFYRDSFDVADAEAVLAGLRASTAPMAAVQLRVLGGAIARVGDDATAYAHRQRRMLVNVAAMYEQAEERDEHAAWAAKVATQLRDPAVAGAYINFLADDGPDRIREAYPGDTWDRLVAVKRRYDPNNLFRLNQNVPPA